MSSQCIAFRHRYSLTEVSTVDDRYCSTSSVRVPTCRITSFSRSGVTPSVFDQYFSSHGSFTLIRDRSSGPRLWTSSDMARLLESTAQLRNGRCPSRLYAARGIFRPEGGCAHG